MKLLLTMMALALASCTHAPAPAPTMGDAGAATCTTACANGLDRGCHWAQPTPAGVSCPDLGAGVTASGVIHWDLACRTRGESCEAIDACEVGP